MFKNKYLKYFVKTHKIQKGASKIKKKTKYYSISDSNSDSDSNSNSESENNDFIKINEQFMDEDDIPIVKIVSFNLTEKEKNLIKDIKIENTYHIDLFYDKDNIIDKILDFLIKIGNNRKFAEDTSKIILKIIENVIKYENEESGIIWLRATTHYKNEQKFRWHRDGSYFGKKYYNNKKLTYKFVTSLKGESTPVIVDHNTIKNFDIVEKNNLKFKNCVWDFIGKNNININNVPKEIFIGMNKLLGPPLVNTIKDNYIQTKTFEGVFFLNSKGEPNSEIFMDGVIHSEPEIQENRLFLAILPAPKEESKKWCERQQ